MRDHDYDENVRQRKRQDYERQEKDLVVAPNEFAYVSDQTKGNINVHVGPLKNTISGTDQLVLFDEVKKKFVIVDMKRAIQTFATAPEGWYIVLKNPAVDGKQPASGKPENLKDLDVGRKINIPGPVSFALWPGQMKKVIKGHILRSNQYLVVRVYDEQSARENWSKTVIKKVDGEEGTPELIDDKNITMGKLFIIKGTEVSFYIPPTGVEVVAEGKRDGKEVYVRDAVTLERLEYCILKDENGKKRYVKGPDVVFPEPTEIFLKKGNTRKFKAIELSPISGLYIKVIADYIDQISRKVLNTLTGEFEEKKELEEGDELFITGNDQMIYYPREEHAIMKYGDKERHHATAIPAGEARYVLDRLTGEIRLEKGPSMFLADPRKEVHVKRILSIKDVERWFPNNQEAISYNMMLEQAKTHDSDGYVEAAMAAAPRRGEYLASRVYDDDWNTEKAVKQKFADVMQRGETFTKPRTLTIDSKYEGAVVIDVWTGYAVKVKSKTKDHRVVVGPATIILEYDETLEHMQLSKGTPKNDNEILETVYLHVKNNKVSDIIKATTKDGCDVSLHLSYRVNFEGDLSKAFDVENYVKFLTDHMRSLGKAVIKGVGIEEFYSNPYDIMRNAFLGEKTEEGREGRFFEENEMRIYEVEILSVNIGDHEIEEMLLQNQNNIVRQQLSLAEMSRSTEFEAARQSLARQTSNETLETALNDLKNRQTKDDEQLKVSLQEQENKKLVAEANQAVVELTEAIKNAVKEAEINRVKMDHSADLANKKDMLDLKLSHIQAEVDAVAKKSQAISPQLIAALQALGDKQLTAALSENLSIWGHLGGKSVVEVIQNLLQGTKLDDIGSLLKNHEIKKKMIS